MIAGIHKQSPCFVYTDDESPVARPKQISFVAHVTYERTNKLAALSSYNVCECAATAATFIVAACLRQSSSILENLPSRTSILASFLTPRKLLFWYFPHVRSSYRVPFLRAKAHARNSSQRAFPASARSRELQRVVPALARICASHRVAPPPRSEVPSATSISFHQQTSRMELREATVTDPFLRS